MTRTSDLIEALVQSGTPVPRLRPPLIRAGMWLALALAVLCLLCVALGARADLVQCLQQPLYFAGMLGALATAILAAVASFTLGIPGSSRRWLLLPLPAMAAWLATIGYGCLTDWVSMSPDGIRMGEAARCFCTVLLVSLPLSMAMLVMLRHAAPLRPGLVSSVAGLAIAAMTSFALRLLHDLDATIMILIWNVGLVGLMTGLAGAFGRAALRWVAAHVLPLLPPQLSTRL